MLREWAEAHHAGATIERIEALADAWLASPEAVQLEPATNPVTGPRYSTPEMLARERELIESGECRRGEGAGVARDEHVREVLDARPELAGEQAALVDGLTRSGDGVQVVRAAAGTGKTFALEAARQAWERSGYRVYGCALSARAALELESQAGIDSATIARLKLDMDRGYGLDDRNVLVVDEAGMVGSRTLAELAAHAEAAKAKLVLVGDDRQLPEIDAGGGFRALADRLGALELHETRRQRHAWDRDALAALRVGGFEEWAAKYREAGRVVARESARGTREQLVADWWQAARTDGVDAVMVAHRRADVADLNERARALMAADDRLGPDQLDVAGRAFAAGDRVLARHNDRRAGIVNGARGEVVAVDAGRWSVTVRLDSGATITVDGAYLDAGHLDHGYAVTAHSAQGATVDKAFVLGSDDLYREWGYTALTRHRDEARFYLVSPGSTERCLPGVEPEPDPLLRDLEEMLGESRQKSLAIDVLDEHGMTPSPAEEEMLARYRAMRAEERRTERELAAAEQALREAEIREAALAEERAALSLVKRRHRAELDERIATQSGARDHWRAEVERLHEDGASLAVKRTTWLEEHGTALSAIVTLEGLASREHDPVRDLVADRDALANEIGGRPLGLAGRDEWAAHAVPIAESHLDVPAPDLQLDAPDIDLGP